MIKIKGGGEPLERVPVTEKLRKTVTKIALASRKVGRPKKENALNGAERAKAYRERKRG